MAPKRKRFATNRFSPLDTNLGSINTAQGMKQDLYEPEDKLRCPVTTSYQRRSLGLSRHPTNIVNDVAGFQGLMRDRVSSEVGPVRYTIDFLLQFQYVPVQEQYEQAPTVVADLKLVPCRTRSGIRPRTIAVGNDVSQCLAPEKPISSGAFPYARLPFELRQMVLRELVPTKSVWNGTSFPKSCPEQYRQDYFEKTKYLQNRALAH